MKNAIVSIIMAAYNAEQTIASSIESVLNQSYSDWELIVVNDNSNDQTANLLARFSNQNSQIKVIQNTKNIGVSMSRQKALNEAKGQWIAILDSDDMWTSDKLEKQINFANQADVELVFTGSAFIRNNGDPINWYLRVPNVLTHNELLKQNLISNSSVLVKKQLYEKFFSVGDNMHEDFAIWLKITKTGKNAYGINEPLLIYRLSKSSKSSNKIKAAIMNWNTYRYVGLNPFVSAYYMFWYAVKSLNKYRHLKF